MRVLQDQFEIAAGSIRHKPTGAEFRFYAQEPIFETVSWATPESEPRVKGYLKHDVWKAAQEILWGITMRKAG